MDSFRGWARRGLSVLACGVVVGCGGGSGDAPAPAPVAAEKLAPADADALLAHFRGVLRATRPAERPTQAGGVPAPQPTSEGTGGALDAFAQVQATSTTLLQEPGVDEDDVLKVDGDIAWTLDPVRPDGSGQRLRAWRIGDGGASLAPLGTLALDPAVRFEGLYLDAPRRRVVAIGRRGALATPLPASSSFATMPAGGVREPATVVVVADAADPSRPTLVHTLELAGSLQASRLAGDRLWVVQSTWPRLVGFDAAWRVPADNERWIAALTPQQILPTRRVDGGAAVPLVTADACWLQPAATRGVSALTTVAAFDLAAPEAAPLARCVTTPVDTVYMTTDALYLATTRWTDPWRDTGAPTPSPTIALLAPAEPVTDLHKLAIGGDSIAYRGSGTVAGRLGQGADTSRFMLSADGPRLRVVSQRDAVATTQAAGPALLTVLADEGRGALETVATLPNARRPEPIGKPGERVHAVRFVGTRAYVVTFRRIDPVYVLDLASPTDPRLLGALEVPGFSERLYPLTDRLLLGVGRDTVAWQGADLQTGVLVSLIDVGDPARPVERARRTIGGRGSSSPADASSRGVTIRAVADGLRIALPVTVHDGPAWASGWEPAAAPWRGFSQLAAVRFHVDPAAPALAERAPVVASTVATTGDGASRRRLDGSIAFDRALDVGQTTWLWADGAFTGAPW